MYLLTGMGQIGRNNGKSWTPSQEWVIAAETIENRTPSQEWVTAAETIENRTPSQEWVRAAEWTLSQGWVSAEIMANHGPPHRNGSDRQK